nr:MAG TPA: hypothetical protein [Bacteriophage sp.]
MSSFHPFSIESKKVPSLFKDSIILYIAVMVL